MARMLIALLMAAVPFTSLAADEAADETGVQQTAVRALRWAFFAQNGYRWEYGGIIVVHDGQLGHSIVPGTMKMIDAVEIDVEKLRAPGDTLVALYHTHPCKSKEYFPQYFSPNDLISAFFYHVPTFILDECTGDVHEFDPAPNHAAYGGAFVTVLRKDGSERRVHLLAGQIVGNIGETGPDLSLIEELMGRKMY